MVNSILPQIGSNFIEWRSKKEQDDHLAALRFVNSQLNHNVTWSTFLSLQQGSTIDGKAQSVRATRPGSMLTVQDKRSDGDGVPQAGHGGVNDEKRGYE